MEYVLDIAKWRCGSFGPNQLGLGRTQMCNEEGYMCCLGQFALQVTGEKPTGAEPKDIQFYDSRPYDPMFVVGTGEDDVDNTALADNLMDINDNHYPPQEKIKLIRKKLEAAGHTLKVINEDLLSTGAIA